MGIRNLVKNSLAALVIGASSIVAMPSASQARQVPKISVAESASEENINALVGNSRYVADPAFVMNDTDFELVTGKLEDGTVGIGSLQQVLNFLFAIPGKLRRPSFMAYSYFGKRRPNYVELDWHKFLSQHLVVGAYDGELHLLDDFIDFEEEAFHEFRDRFGFSQFHKKPVVVLYKNGNEFLQDKLFYPDRGTAGVTKVLGRNEMATYFNGHRQDFDHTNKHEFVHWFDIQFMNQLEEEQAGKSPLFGGVLGNMQLWMIEGLAEYYSTGWRSVHEQIMRDLWHNGIFIPIEQLPYFQGSFLTYTLGNFYTEFMEETFGKGTALKIRRKATTRKVEDILEAATGKKVEELNRMARDYLAAKFKDMEGRADTRKVLDEGYLLAADNGRFLTWGFDEGHIMMYLSKVNEQGLVKKKVVQDFEYGYESLMTLFFGASVGMRDDQIVFSVNDSGRDKLVLQRFAETDKGFDLEDRIEREFDRLDNIYSPQFVNYSTVVFVGARDGQQDLFTYNFATGRLGQLTNDRRGVAGLDVRGDWVVYSMEDGKTSNPNGCDYDLNLYLRNLKTGESRQLTFDEADETRPRFSPDGRFIVFQKEINFVNSLFVHDLRTGVAVQLEKEIIGAANPQFLDGGVIAFNTRKLLVPQVRVMEFGDLDAIIRKELEMRTAGDIGMFRIRKNELLLKDPMVGPDGAYRLNDRAVTEIISHDGSLYFINEKDVYKKTGDVMSRHNPVPHDHRIAVFRKGIAKDIEFLEKNALIYDMDVSEDGSQAVILLNEKFLNRKAFKDYLKKVPDDATPVLIYSGIQSLFSKDNPPAVHYDRVLTGNKEKVDVEFLSNGQVLLHNRVGVSMRNPKGQKNMLGTLDELLEREGIDGEVEKFAVSGDKRFVAVQYLKNVGFWGEDIRSLVVYDAKANNAMLVFASGRQAVGNAKFLDNRRLFFSLEDNSKVGFYSFDLETGGLIEKVHGKFSDKDKLLKVAAAGKDIVFSMYEERDDDKSRALYATTFGRTVFRVLSKGRKYSGFRTLDDIITYKEADVYGKKELRALDYGTLVISPRKVKMGDHQHMIVSDGRALYDINLASNSAGKLVNNAFGFDVRGDTVIFSKAVGNVFNIFSYNTATGDTEQLTNNKFNSFRPVFADDAVYYEAGEDGRTYVRKMMGGIDEMVPLNNPATGLEFIEGNLQAKVLEKEKKPEEKKPEAYSYEEGVIDTKEFSPWPVHEVRAGIVAASDGSNFLFMIDYLGFNELHTGLSFANVYYTPDFKLGSIGFVDLDDDYALKADIVGFSDNIDAGLAFIKSFPFNAYLGLEGEVGINYQDYPHAGIKTTRHNVYPTVAAAISYDATTFDYLRGPREGTRGFLRLETGYSVTDGVMNHYDVNADIRNYVPIIGRWGTSQRLMAGTSQGLNNHLYLLGGNISMRGVPFDSLLGQNYAVANLDMQFPIFEAVGAAFAGTNYLNPIFSMFDVRMGPYFDAGMAFNNDGMVKPVYSAGIDINAICFGAIILRYNKGMFGKTDWNFWFGYSP